MRVDFRDQDGIWFHSGQSENCLNIRVYSNGATDEHYDTDPQYAEDNIDEIHICDIEAFITSLETAKAARDAEPRSW